MFKVQLHGSNISRSGGTKKDISLPVAVVLPSRDRNDHITGGRICFKEDDRYGENERVHIEWQEQSIFNGFYLECKI